MHEQFSALQISKVIDQALFYQCACPAQICKAIFELRELHAYQMNCASDSSNDERVHQSISQAVQASHQLMEACLQEILEIEGWDPSTFEMPNALKNRATKMV